MNGLNPAYVESVIRKANGAKAEAGGKAEVHTRTEPPLEKVCPKGQKRLETSHLIMTPVTSLSNGCKSNIKHQFFSKF